MIRKIISGGQTGGDQGGLAAAIILGKETGGLVPHGWRTDDGPAPWLANFGYREHSSETYPPRTRANVEGSDGTLIFGDVSSPGCRLTYNHAVAVDRPVFIVPWSPGREIDEETYVEFQSWLVANNIQILNVAGNRESSQPGIGEATRDFLLRTVE